MDILKMMLGGFLVFMGISFLILSFREKDDVSSAITGLILGIIFIVIGILAVYDFSMVRMAVIGVVLIPMGIGFLIESISCFKGKEILRGSPPPKLAGITLLIFGIGFIINGISAFLNILS